MVSCRITVLRRTLHRDLMDEFLDRERGICRPCTAFEDGQEFLIKGFPLRPDGFCDWAWADIHKDVMAVMFGADYPWIAAPGTAITCCTDGLRPVVFKVERVPDGTATHAGVA
jgi:uncharacterized repeat protein (TIGR04076 family)